MDEWIPHAHGVIRGGAALLVLLIATVAFDVIFRHILQRHHLRRAYRIGAVAIALYVAILTAEPRHMFNLADVGGQQIHRVFVAVMLYVGLRLLDGLAIMPLLTRGGKLPLPRFVHQIVVIVLGVFFILGYCAYEFDLNVTNFLAGSAVISIVLGLALQETLGNFFSGMVVQASSPFTLGDWIVCAGVEGKVVDMTWRAVTIHTLDDNFVLVPNSVIAKEQIVNFNTPDTKTALSVKVGLEYDVPPTRAKEVLHQAAMETPGVLADPSPLIFVEDFGDSAIVYKIKFWIDKPSAHPKIESEVRNHAWHRLKQAGIGIPFPIRTVEMVNVEEKTQRADKSAHQSRASAIGGVMLLAPLSDQQRQELAAEAREIVLAPGQVLFHQNDTGDSFFILRHGTVDVLVKQPDGSELKVAQITEGNFFGEMSALTGQPRSATIRAATAIACIEITRDNLHAIFKADAGILEQVSNIVAQRQADTQAKMKDATTSATPETKQAMQKTMLDRVKKFFGLFK